MQGLKQTDQLRNFIAASPTPFHAVETIQTDLLAAGFEALDETQPWSLTAGKGYFVTRNGSSVIAFNYGEKPLVESGIRMIGAHTDSPCLKVKPNADLIKHGYYQLGVEVYGGVLLNPWFDRGLSLAGKVSVRVGESIEHLLLDFNRAIGSVPSLAIHLDRSANTSRTVNPQTDIPVVLQLADSGKTLSFKDLLKNELLQQYSDMSINEVLDYEMSFYDVQQGELYGLENEFFAAARLDNLLSCFAGLEALKSSPKTQSSLFVFNDHEEVGSESAAGAAGTMLNDFLERLLPHGEDRIRAIQQSIMLSVDNAHALHPNYPAKHDDQHGPLINAGPVIKINAKQRYASNTETQSFFRLLCEKNNIPVQAFVVRNDMACGSTIGPITATNLGVPTVDIGVPTWGMHSIRETAGVKDLAYLVEALQAFVK